MHRHSALETIYKVGKYSSSEKQSLTFKELKSLEILQIACWPDKIDEMNNLLSKELKIKNIPSFNKGIIFENKSFGNIKPIKLNLFDNIDSKIYLINEKKNIDFFLKIEGGNFNYNSLLSKINEVPLVQACYLVNLKSQKSKYNLIFE